MRFITAEIIVPPYLFDWLVNKYGNPLRFPSRSPQNDLLHALVAVARPKHGNETPKMNRGVAVKVVLPNRSIHKPEYYHHLSKAAKIIFIRDLKRFFRLDLTAFVIHAATKGGLTLESLERWCMSRGIKISHRDAVKRMYYRMKKQLEEQGILLPSKFPKSVQS